MKKLSLFLLALVLGFISCNNQNQEDNKVGNVNKEKGFIIKNGVNVSHWLSQTEIRGKEREEYVSANDFKKIAEMGFDHVRLPIDEMHLWDEDGNQIDTALQLMHNAIKWSFENKLRVIVDLHVLRSHHFNYDSERLWKDTVAQQQFWGFWEQLSEELIKYPTDSLAYEPLNEAVADNHEDWNNLIGKGIATIRKNEPNRTIIVGSNRWQIVQTFEHLKVPENDSNIILSFHFYDPFMLTHYKAPWTGILSKYEGDIIYPGYAVDTAIYSELNPELVERIKEVNYDCNINSMEERILLAVNEAKKRGLKLYCGEFGCFPLTPIEFRKALYSDLTKIFNKHDIARAHWNYKNDFPLVDPVNLEPITELVSILVNDSLVMQ